jgi:rare lipoprotein A
MSALNRRLYVLAALLIVAGCTTREPVPPSEKPVFRETGVASWYGADHQGAETASGERYDMKAMTAAHPTLPLQTVARVTALDTGRSAKVRINDRGPHTKGRVIDLSSAAASAIGARDLTTVRVEVFKSDQ